MVNNTVLKDLLKEYDKKQQKAVYDMEIRRKELYDRIPRLQEIAFLLWNNKVPGNPPTGFACVGGSGSYNFM